ncbi:MAG: hypothetical protein PHC28_17980 [Flavobacterium sp.]|uniref:hypothetical protein n=1 Tax=Flavobacterium sp. TaxID=239 RepID=UPI00260FB357|nr:hypothetical protein [Flavobacterium sp.]MDD5152336.1 hypothetical protein [Flavobacterium sp.]
MKTLKYILKAIPFFKSLNIKTKANSTDKDDFEFTHTKFGVNLKQTSTSDKTPNSLFHQMYSEENETLFI